MSDIEELRRRRMQALIQQQTQQTFQQQMQEQAQAEEIENQIRLIIRNILTPEARERLANIRLARPEFARQLELLLIQLKQSGQLPSVVDDSQLKGLLLKIKGKRHETKIDVR